MLSVHNSFWYKAKKKLLENNVVFDFLVAEIFMSFLSLFQFFYNEFILF